MPNKDIKIYVDYSHAPDILMEFIRYLVTIKGLSRKTARGYFIDLQMFLRFMIQHRNDCVDNSSINEVDISNIDLDFISKITQSDITDFLYFLTEVRKNEKPARARKLSSIKSYFNYLTVSTSKLTVNPAEKISLPSLKKTLPKYLTVDQSLDLLNNIQTSFTERDYCIILLFLSCGMRLSELVNIDLTDIRDDTIKIIGKGNKERSVYLNDSCLIALDEYLTVRNSIVSPVSEPALFISKRTGKRLSDRRVEQIVEQCFKLAGLSGQGFSVHKLRHTAATQLYRYGGADMLTLRDILGHEDVSTTSIYTHLDNESVKNVAKSSPLANVKKPNK